MITVQRSKLIVLINLMFFLVGMLVSIMSALIPNMIKGFNISYTIAATLPFAFYLSFAFLSIPAGIANERLSSKKILLFSLCLVLLGVLLFVVFLDYSTSLISLFIIGSAVAIIQVSSVPLLRRICGPDNFAFHSTLNQLVYGFGAYLSPNIFSFLTTNLLNKNFKQNFFFYYLSLVIPEGYEWVSAYWLIALIVILTIIITISTKFPVKKRVAETVKEDRNAYWKLLKNKYVIFYFMVLVAYASCEQGNAVWMSKFFQDHYALDPTTAGASILSWYWILLSFGCLIGMLCLKLFDSRRVLAAFAIFAIISFTLGLYANVEIARVAFPLVGLFESVMWPIILSLAINSVSQNHETLTGFMFTASIGGALGPFVIGSLGDYGGLHFSLHYIYIPLLVVLSVAFWAKPLINNKTLKTVLSKNK
jgi:fucose permease